MNQVLQSICIRWTRSCNDLCHDDSTVNIVQCTRIIIIIIIIINHTTGYSILDVRQQQNGHKWIKQNIAFILTPLPIFYVLL